MDLMYPAVQQDGFKKIYSRCAHFLFESWYGCWPDVAAVRRSDIPMIATCRDVGGQEGWGLLRKELLELGITGGATHVDIEVLRLCWSSLPPLSHTAPSLTLRLRRRGVTVRAQVEAPKEWKTEMVALAKKHNVQVIISHHNYDSTPNAERLQEIVTECFADGADIAKIAVAAQTKQDTARVLALHDDDRPVVMLAMGEQGKISRVAGPLLGAPFTFVAATPETATAPGQLTAAQMRGLYASM